MKTLFLGSALGLLLSGLTQTAEAQFTYAVNTENILTSSFGVGNTGCATVNYNGTALNAFCWDGATPGIAVEHNGSVYTGSLPTGAIDPDIVIDPRGFSTRRLAVVYELNSAIYYEGWEFNGSAFTPGTGSMVVYAGTGECSNPNIDVAVNGEIGITFQSDLNSLSPNAMGIMGQDINSFPITFSPESIVDFQCIALCEGFYPDVKLSLNHTTGKVEASFIMITTEGGYDPYYQGSLLVTIPKTLLVHTIPTWQFFSGSIGANDCDIIFQTNKPHHEVGRPRIAGPVEMVAEGDQYQAVIKSVETYEDEDHILGFNSKQDVTGIYIQTMTQLNESASSNPHALFTCTNRDPAVSASDDYDYQTTWSYYNNSIQPCTAQAINNSFNIVTRQLNQFGAPNNADYSIANQNIAGNQFASSVAGRYSHPYDEMLYFWIDDNGQLSYKNVPISSIALKNETQASPASENELEANFYSNSVLAVGHDTHVQLYGMDGRLLKEIQANAGSNLYLNEWAASGIYLLNQQTANGSTKTEKIVITP